MNAALYNLDRPDEKTDLNLKDASQEEVVKVTYKAWLKGTEEFRREHHSDGFPSEYLYGQARQIIRPFKEKLGDTISTEDFFFITENRESDPSLYLSALLNETNLKKLSIGRFPDNFPHFGYRLKPGKTVEVLEDGKVWNLGMFAEGGTVINNGKIEELMGHHARGGVWLNRGIVNMEMGPDASGGIWINQGKICSTMGMEASGGIWLNHHYVGDSIGYKASSGVFVTKNSPSLGFSFGFMGNTKGPACGVAPKELSEDIDLVQLMDQIEQASKNNRFADVKKLARKVDSHVRANYQPKKVA